RRRALECGPVLWTTACGSRTRLDRSSAYPCRAGAADQEPAASRGGRLACLRRIRKLLPFVVMTVVCWARRSRSAVASDRFVLDVEEMEKALVGDDRFRAVLERCL